MLSISRCWVVSSEALNICVTSQDILNAVYNDFDHEDENQIVPEERKMVMMYNILSNALVLGTMQC